MKKLFLLLALITIPLTTQAADCPYGLTDDPYPGQCVLYQDANGDYICDLSQESGVTAQIISTSSDLEHLITGQELKAQTVAQVATIYKINSETLRSALAQKLNRSVKLTDTFQTLHDNYDLSPDVAKKIASDLASGILPATKKATTRDYYMWQITVITLTLYLASLLLVKRKKITTVQNRKFWNIILLLSFIPTTITSIVILLRLNYGINLPSATNANFWHIEFGFIMIIVAICHALWHLPYYRSFLAKRKFSTTETPKQ